MKKSLISIALLLASSAVFAETEYLENPVLRPLTLTDGAVSVGGALAWGEEKDDNCGEFNQLMSKLGANLLSQTVILRLSHNSSKATQS